MSTMQPIGAIRESILHAKDEKALKLVVEIATLMANQLDEIPERTKRRWKLAEKRASRRLQRKTESAAAKAKKVEQKSNMKQRKGNKR